MDVSEALNTIGHAQKLSRKDDSAWSFIVPGALFSIAAFSFGGSMLLHGTSWMDPLIAVTGVAGVGVLAVTALFNRRGGISPLPGAGLTMTQRWRYMWVSLAVTTFEIALACTVGLAWAAMAAGVLHWLPQGLRERARRK